MVCRLIPRSLFDWDGTMTTRVLIVDDEESMRTLLRSWVEREGGSTVIEASIRSSGDDVRFEQSALVQQGHEVRDGGGCGHGWLARWVTGSGAQA